MHALSYHLVISLLIMRVFALAFGAITALSAQSSAFAPLASLSRQGTVVHDTIRSEWRMDDPEPEVKS
jgi:hypothetical protein